MHVETITRADILAHASIVTAPNTPDILELRTTNVPHAHTCLVQLRQREDHPQNGPREVWVDLSACQSVNPDVGDVLVRAMRLAQFLPRGFIGSSAKVQELANAARLPCLLDRSLVPGISPTPKNTLSHDQLAMSQNKDILADMHRRLVGMQNDYLALQARSADLGEALSVVRGQKQSLEEECRQALESSTQHNVQMEKANHQRLTNESEISALVDRVNQAEHAREKADFRLSRLQSDYVQARQNVITAQSEAASLRNTVQAMEVAVPVSRSQHAQLQAAAAVLQELNEQLHAHVAAVAKTTLREQIDLETQLTHMQDELVATKEQLDAAHTNAVMTNQMLDDALSHADDLTQQSTALADIVEQQRQHGATLRAEQEQLRKSLRQAEENCANASMDAVEARSQATSQSARIVNLLADNVALEAGQTALPDTRAALMQSQTLLCEASASVESLSSQVIYQHATLEDLTTRNIELSNQLSATQTALGQFRARSATMETEIATLNQKIVEQNLTAEHVSTRADQIESALTNASAEVADLESSLKTERFKTCTMLARITHAEERSAMLQSDLDVARAERDSVSRSMEAAASEFSSLQIQTLADIDILKAQLTDETTKRDTMSTRIEILQGALNKNTQQNDQLQQTIVAMHEQVSIACDERTQMISRLDAAASATEDDKRKMRVKDTVLVEQDASLRALTTELETAYTEMVTVRTQSDTIASVIDRQKQMIGAASISMSKLETKLADAQQSYRLSIAETTSVRGDLAKLQESTNKQETILSQMRADLVIANETTLGKNEMLVRLHEQLAQVGEHARSERVLRAETEIQLVETQTVLADLHSQTTRDRLSPTNTSHHAARVRTGERLTIRGDLVVSKPVSSGAEVTAEGSVHLYGPMRGRVHAGCTGDLTSRIYCMNFYAEQVAIAGRCVTFDTIPPELLGKPVEIWYDNSMECMQIAPLVTE